MLKSVHKILTEETHDLPKKIDNIKKEIGKFKGGLDNINEDFVRRT